MPRRRPIRRGSADAAQAQNGATAVRLFDFGSTGEEGTGVDGNVEWGAVRRWFGGREDASPKLVSVTVWDGDFCFSDTLGGRSALRGHVLTDLLNIFEVGESRVGGEDLKVFWLGTRYVRYKNRGRFELLAFSNSGSALARWSQFSVAAGILARNREKTLE